MERVTPEGIWPYDCYERVEFVQENTELQSLLENLRDHDKKLFITTNLHQGSRLDYKLSEQYGLINKINNHLIGHELSCRH